VDEYFEEEVPLEHDGPRAVTVVQILLVFLGFCGYCVIIGNTIAPVTINGAVVALMIGWAAMIALIGEALR
jgi:hypothetical protein